MVKSYRVIRDKDLCQHCGNCSVLFNHNTRETLIISGANYDMSSIGSYIDKKIHECPNGCVHLVLVN